MLLTAPYLISLLLHLPQQKHAVTVVDRLHKTPVAAVVVQVDKHTLYTDALGKVELPVTYRSLALSRIGYAPLHLTPSTLPANDTIFLQPVAQALAEVTVRPPGPPIVLTSAADKLTAPNPSYPGTQIAIWFNSPDSLRSYGLQSIAIPVKEKFQAGKVRLSIHPKGTAGALFGSNLLPESTFIGGEAVSTGKHPILQFDASAFGLVLPATGFFLVLECFSSSDKEVMQDSPRMVSKKGPNKKGITKGTAYIDTVVEQDGVATTNSVSVDQYPQFITSPLEGPSRTWRRFSPKLPFRQLNPVVIGKHKVGSYNIAASVQIEPL